MRMNRAIKIRAWDTVRNRFLEAYEMQYLYIDSDGRVQYSDSAPFNPRDERTVLLTEFTGLVDKNGTEIFEGDIVRIGSRVHEIVFKDGAFVIMITLVHDGSLFYLDARHDFLNMEIIGNRYENPELLEGICTASN